MDAREQPKRSILSQWSERLVNLCRDATTPPKYEDVAPLYCQRSLGVFPKSSWVRRSLILLTHTRAFEIVVLLAIVANCVTLALDSNAPGFRTSRRGQQLLLADYVFTGFFTVEALLKILAMGLVAKPNTYLRSGWNCLDIAIIATGYISIAGFANVTALRAIRALRPLRTITRLKEMRAVVTSMVKSLPGLADVTLLMAFYFAIFGTMFVLLFNGKLQNRCGDPDFSLAYTNDDGIVQGVRYVVKDGAKEDVCNQPHTSHVWWRNETGQGLVATGLQSSHGWAYDCDATPSGAHPFGQFCTPFKNPGAEGFPDSVPGYSNFDNILLSWLAVFQHVTMTDWSFVMYSVQDGVNWWTWLLFFFVCFMGGMLLINLIVAVIFITFQKILWAKEETDSEDLLESSTHPDADPDARTSDRDAVYPCMMDNHLYSANTSWTKSVSEAALRPEAESMSLADPPLKSLMKLGMEEEEAGVQTQPPPRMPPLQQQLPQMLQHGMARAVPRAPAGYRNAGKAGPVAEGAMCRKQECTESRRENARAEKACMGKAGPVAEGAVHLEQQGRGARRRNVCMGQAYVGKAGPVAEGSMHLGKQGGGARHRSVFAEQAYVEKAGPVAEGSMRLGQRGMMSNSAPGMPHAAAGDAAAAAAAAAAAEALKASVKASADADEAVEAAAAAVAEAAAAAEAEEAGAVPMAGIQEGEQMAPMATAEAMLKEVAQGGKRGEEDGPKSPQIEQLSPEVPPAGPWGPGRRLDQINRSCSAPRAPPWKHSKSMGTRGKQSDSDTGLGKLPFRHCESSKVGRPEMKRLDSPPTSRTTRSSSAWMRKEVPPPFPDIVDFQGLDSSASTRGALSKALPQYHASLSPPKESSGQMVSHQQALDLARDSDQDANCSCWRSTWLWFRAACFRLVTNPKFEFFTAIVIILNAIVLGLNWYLMPPKLERATHVMNYVFTCYFVVEIIVRITGRGFNGFFFATRFMRMNWFDFIITLASLAEMLVQLIPGSHGAAFNGGLTAIRLLRLFRLARYWDGLNHILQILGHALSSGIYLLGLVLLFMFIMGLVGMQLFGYNNVWCGMMEGASQRCPPGEDCPPHRDCYVDCEPAQLGQWFEVEHSPYNGLAYCEQFPRNFMPDNPGNDFGWPLTWAQVGKPVELPQHFDNMLTAFLTVFIIVTLDNWTDFMFPMMSIMTPWVAIYFVVVIVLGAFLLLQLFLAILLTSMDKMNELNEHKKKAGLKDSSMSLGHMFKQMLQRVSNSTKATFRDMLLTPPEKGQQQQQRQQQQQQQQEQTSSPATHLSFPGIQHSCSPALPATDNTSELPKLSPASASYRALERTHACLPTPSWSSKMHTARASASYYSLACSQGRSPSSLTSTVTEVTAPSSFPSASAEVNTPSSIAHASPLPPAIPPANTSTQITKLPFQRRSLETMEGQSGRLCLLPPRTSARSGNKISPGGSACATAEGPVQEEQVQVYLKVPVQEDRVQADMNPSAFFTAPDFLLDDGDAYETTCDNDNSPLHGLVSDDALEAESMPMLSDRQQQSIGSGHMSTSVTNLPLPPLQHKQQQPRRSSLPGTPQLTPHQSTGSCEDSSVRCEGEHDLWLRAKKAQDFDGRPSQHAANGATTLGGRLRERQARRAANFALLGKQQQGQQEQELQQQEVQEDGGMVLEGRSCFCFGRRSRLRIFAAKVMTHKLTIYFVNAMVALSCVILTLEVVSLDRKSTKAIVLRNLDAATTAIFGVEIILKCIHQGVLFNGPNSYLRNGWNQWDVFVVAISLVVLSIDASDQETFTWLRALRGLRGLRILHAATAIEGINVVMLALRKLLPSLVNVLWVGLLFYYIFAVLAVALLAGKMHYCAEEGGGYIDPYYVLPQGETITKAWCKRSDSKHNGPRTITTSHYHSQIGVAVPPYELLTTWTTDLRRFDNVVTALWVFYQMASVELWSDVMFAAQDATGQDEQPIRSANQPIGLFFVLFMFVGSLTVLNLIVGISINKFHEMREESQGQSPLLTQEQQNWLTVQGLIADTEIVDLTVPSNSKFRHLVHKLMYNKVTDAFMMITILGNMAVMFTAHYNMFPEFEEAITLTNLIVTAIFFVEMVGKLIAIGFKTYCKNGWNIFDAVITLLSIMSVLIANISESTVEFLPVLRILRVVRIFRLIPRAQGLRKMLRTLYMSIPAVSNVAFVLLVFMYLWAIVGMNLFGNIRFTDNGSGLNRNANFQHFPVAMITEFRMLSGEDWNDIMLDCMQLEDCYKVLQGMSVEVPDGDGNFKQVVLEAGQYLDPVDDRDIIEALPRDAWRDECSINPMLAVLYFCIFMLVCTYIMIQLVIGIVLEGIQMQSFLDEMGVGQDDVQNFVKAWLELDPQGTSFIHVKLLTSLLSKVPPPLGVKGLPQELKSVQEIVLSVDVPLRQNSLTVHFTEVLHALAGRVMGAEVPEQEESSVFSRLMDKMPKGRPHYTAAHVYAAMAVSSAVRGFLQRKVLGDVLEQLEEEGIVTISGSNRAEGKPSADLQKSFARLGAFNQGMQNRLASALQKERGLSTAEAMAQVQALREASCSHRNSNPNQLGSPFCDNMMPKQRP